MYLRIEGVTLIELIIVMALVAILVGAVSFTFAVGLESWSSGRNRSEIRQDGNLSLERMVRELSQASSITIAHADRIKFDADVDGDGTDETITFNFDDDNNNLNRTVVGGATTILAPNVQTFGLSYRDLDDTLLSLPQHTNTQVKRDRIRVIIISLTMDKGDETITLSSSVYARNQ